MSAKDPIKGCPQPDPPELVMRADGYHYRTEDEMKDKTVGSMPTETSLMLAAQAWCEPETSSIVMNVPLATAFARILDRALNATADLEHQSAGKPVAWLLTDKNINDIQVGSVQRLIDRARQAHFTDLIIRINGKDERHQADWLKHLVRATPPLNAPPPRTYEQENAVKESHRNKIADDYFDARPVFVLAPRPCFNDGFNLGWDAAKKDAPADPNELTEKEKRLFTIVCHTYQILGALDAPEHVLDVLSNPFDVTDGQVEALLPFTQDMRNAALNDAEVIDLIGQRDHREEIIDQLCDAVLGPDRAEWSSAYYFEDAVSEVQERIAELETRKECRESNAAAEQGEQEPKPAYSREFGRGMLHALAELRAEVEALQKHRWDARSPDMFYAAEVLALIDKMGGKV